MTAVLSCRVNIKYIYLSCITDTIRLISFDYLELSFIWNMNICLALTVRKKALAIYADIDLDSDF